jgi:hypothetical protein
MHEPNRCNIEISNMRHIKNSTGIDRRTYIELGTTLYQRTLKSWNFTFVKRAFLKLRVLEHIQLSNLGLRRASRHMSKSKASSDFIKD